MLNSLIYFFESAGQDGGYEGWDSAVFEWSAPVQYKLWSPTILTNSLEEEHEKSLPTRKLLKGQDMYFLYVQYTVSDLP